MAGGQGIENGAKCYVKCFGQFIACSSEDLRPQDVF